MSGFVLDTLDGRTRIYQKLILQKIKSGTRCNSAIKTDK